VPTLEKLRAGIDVDLYERGRTGTKFLSRAGIVYYVPKDGELRYVAIGRLGD
jgi:hypothetical protein